MSQTAMLAPATLRCLASEDASFTGGPNPNALLAAAAAKDTQIPADLQAAIEATRHAVEPHGAGFKAGNPTQNSELPFSRTAASVRLPAAEVRLRLDGCGRGIQLAQPEAGTLTPSKNHADYRLGPWTEWYVNTAAVWSLACCKRGSIVTG